MFSFTSEWFIKQKTFFAVTADRKESTQKYPVCFSPRQESLSFYRKPAVFGFTRKL